mgnify:CR=1 FL=1
MPTRVVTGSAIASIKVVDVRPLLIVSGIAPTPPPPPPPPPPSPASGPLPTRHLNIANKWAEEFYKKSIGNNAPLPYAVEVDSCQRDNNGELRVMQTRYCVRRELGACIKTADGKKLPKDLWLRSENLRLRLEFDCANCRMNVYHSKES